MFQKLEEKKSGIKWVSDEAHGFQSNRVTLSTCMYNGIFMPVQTTADDSMI